MKKHFLIIVVIGLLAWLMPSLCVAQDEYLVAEVSSQLDEYYKELQKMDKQIVTAEDAEKFEPQYTRQIKYVETIFNAYSELISTDKKLRGLYENYNDLYLSLGKRIEQLLKEKERQELSDKLSVKLNNYLERLTVLEKEGNRHVTNKYPDSLDFVKKKALECKAEADQDYNPNHDFIDDDETLSQSWNQIKDTCTRIDALKVEIVKGIDMDLILKIAGILAAVVLIVTLISNKIKTAKLTQPKKEPKKPKPEEQTPSI